MEQQVEVTYRARPEALYLPGLAPPGYGTVGRKC